MRIGLITNMMDRENAGIKRYTENLVKNLLLIDKKNKYFLIHSNKRKYTFNGNYKEIRLPFFDSIPKKMITGAFVFERVCADYHLDVLHDLGQISPFFIKSKTKKIITIFDLTPITNPQFFTRLTRIYTKLFPLVIKNTDQIITISNNSKKDIERILRVPKEKITVVYLGVEEKFKIINDKKNLRSIKRKYNLPKKFILFVGTIEPRKNLPILIKAFKEIKKDQDIKLVIAGNKGWKYEEVFKIIDQLRMKEDIMFPGFIDEEDLSLVYNLAEFFAYPSSYEGFGFPVLEAMKCGCPVITSKNSSLIEISGNNAVLMNPKNSKEFVKALNNVLIDKDLRNQLKRKGLNWAKKFNWKNCARETLNIYQSLK